MRACLRVCVHVYICVETVQLLTHAISYPTGNTAVLVIAMSPGIFSHYVLSDDNSHVLAYFDDLGRGFSYYERNHDQR